MGKQPEDLKQALRRYCAKTTVRALLVLIFLFQPGRAVTCAAQSVSPEAWHRLTSDKAFNYRDDSEEMRKPAAMKSNFFQKAINSFFNFFDHGGGRLLLWIIVAGVVGYVFYKLVLDKDSFLFGRNRSRMTGDEAVADTRDDIGAADWALLLQQAVAKQETRLAVRYSYMWLLKMLQQRDLIKYRTDKTNFEYYTELSGTDLRQPFKQLSRQYEYAWYGDYALTEAAYRDYIALFDKVRNQLEHA